MMHGFAVVWSERELLLSGLANTVWLSLLAGLCAMLLGSLLAAALAGRTSLLTRGSRLFVDTMRCTPFLLFAYIVYYGLPSLGLRRPSSRATISWASIPSFWKSAAVSRSRTEVCGAAPAPERLAQPENEPKRRSAERGRTARRTGSTGS